MFLYDHVVQKAKGSNKSCYRSDSEWFFRYIIFLLSSLLIYFQTCYIKCGFFCQVLKQGLRSQRG